ncbi:unnamed protein product [Cuscuta campestris]|uniref:Uncharacterized protein n=1 Tax=Cuscuta campestris TaxID=132261 RepID=A0A484MKH3_9ASTE|nr:unnamed protein product [Cuscuta campestris]
MLEKEGGFSGRPVVEVLSPYTAAELPFKPAFSPGFFILSGLQPHKVLDFPFFVCGMYGRISFLWKCVEVVLNCIGCVGAIDHP